MKFVINTTDKHREAFLLEAKKLAKKLNIYKTQTLKKTDPSLGALNVDQLLRVEVMMGNQEGVICALLLGAKVDKEIIRLATAYKDKTIIKAVKEFTPAPLQKTRKLKKG